METDGALDVEEMEKENRCMQRSESKINTSPSGEPLEGANAVTVETPTAVPAPGGPLMAGVGMNLQTNPLEDSPRLRKEAALARGMSVETQVPDVIICMNHGENISEAEESGLTVSNVSIDMNLFIDVIAESVAGKSRQNFENANVSSVLNESRVEIVSSGAECYDFIVSNDLIDVKTSLVEVMGKPLPKFCGSSASVIATSCYEENILRESQVRSPGDCENLSTECTESNDEFTGEPWNFLLCRMCNGKFSSSGNARSKNASVEAVHDEKPQEDASSETLCDLLDQTALQNNKFKTEIENETGIEPELVHNMTIDNRGKSEQGRFFL
jgi:hypothetical protein